MNMKFTYSSSLTFLSNIGFMS